MDWNLENLAVLSISTFVAIGLFKLAPDDLAVPAAFFSVCSAFGIIYEPGGWLAAILGASPFIGYTFFEKTPAGRRRRAERESREAQSRKDEAKRAQSMQKQRAAREIAEKAAEQSRLGAIAREKTRQMNESLEWISVRTWGENVLAKGPTAERSCTPHLPTYP